MQSQITLTVSNTLESITDYKGSYTRTDLSKAVAYWLNIINNIADPRPIAICFGAGSTTFQTVAVLLALIDSGRDYYKFDQLAPGATKETIKYPKIEGGVSSTFIVGTVQTDFNYSDDPDVYEAESLLNKAKALGFEQHHSLEISFRLSQKRYNNTSGTSTGFPKLIEASVGNDGYSIKTAMDYYIKKDDHCVFLHGMSHIGVHTTAILPSIFKAKHITFASSGHKWNECVCIGNHMQYFYTMLNWNILPECHTIKTVTTGGDFLSPILVEELIVNKGVEKIIDIYGLTEAAPPLAIREITCLADLAKPFIWINDAYDCYLDERDTAVVIRPDGVHWKSNDLARYNPETKEFFYLGRHGSGARIRMNDILVSTPNFRKIFEEETNIVNYFLDTTKQGIPTLLVLETDKDKTLEFIANHAVTMEVNFVDIFTTNGGIKNTL